MAGTGPAMTRLRRAGERAVDHGDGVLEAVDRRERAEARALLLAEQHLIEHVEPFERHARLAVPALDLAGAIEERLAPADLIHHLLNLLRRRVRRQLREAVAQIEQRRALGLGRLAELLRRQDEIVEILDRLADERGELGMHLRGDAGTIAADEAPQRLGVFGVRRRNERE